MVSKSARTGPHSWSSQQGSHTGWSLANVHLVDTIQSPVCCPASLLFLFCKRIPTSHRAFGCTCCVECVQSEHTTPQSSARTKPAVDGCPGAPMPIGRRLRNSHGANSVAWEPSWFAAWSRHGATSQWSMGKSAPKAFCHHSIAKNCDDAAVGPPCPTWRRKLANCMGVGTSHWQPMFSCITSPPPEGRKEGWETSKAQPGCIRRHSILSWLQHQGVLQLRPCHSKVLQVDHFFQEPIERWHLSWFEWPPSPWLQRRMQLASL